MSLKRSMLKTLAMLAMRSTMTADKNIYSNQRLSNEGMRFNPDYRRPSTSRELKEFTIKGKRSVHTQEKMQSKDLKQEGNYETDSRSSD